MSIQSFCKTSFLVSGLALSLPYSQLHAQQACFLQGMDGQMIDLGYLCGSNSPANPTAKTQVFHIPIKRRISGIPTVDVTFNGKHTFEMLFDTGASAIAITPRMAKVLGIQAEKEQLSDTAGGAIKFGVGKANSVQAGNLTAQNLRVGIVPTLNEPGLLGQNFYGYYDVTIKHKVIELRPRQQ
jgi:clan AA aspartic protease (TIGR02281 family)